MAHTDWRDRMLKIYKWNETDFSKNGLASLVNAKDVCCHRAINGEITLEFALSPADENWKYVREENIVTLEGQRYRIKSIQGRIVTAYPVYQDSSGKHIQYIEDLIGQTATEIMKRLFVDTDIKIADDTELAVNGLERVEDLTDYFEQSKITPISGLKTLMENLEKYGIHNELYVNNNTIALVKQLGKNRGARVNLYLNASEIEPTRDTTELITRLYPYGSSDLHIGSVNNNVQYIDSPNINNFPLREGYIDFDDIDTPEKLLEIAKEKFATDNPERIDIPKYSVNVSLIATANDIPIMLGDIVKVYDPQYNITSLQRVISEEYYPFEPNRSRITVGQPPKSVLTVLDGVVDSTKKYNATTNSRGELKVSSAENLKSVCTTYINNGFNGGKVYKRGAVHSYGDIWQNPNDPEQAIAIIDGVLLISNGKTADEEWDWQVLGDWSGITANHINLGKLDTSKVLIGGEKNRLTISDNALTVTDENGVVRLKIGEEEGQFKYLIFNSDGQEIYNGENEITGATGSFTATGADGQNLNVSVENGLITQII